MVLYFGSFSDRWFEIEEPRSKPDDCEPFSPGGSQRKKRLDKMIDVY